jgi:hypothetical protein
VVTVLDSFEEKGLDLIDLDPQACADVFVRKTVCLAQKIDLATRLTEFGDGLRMQSEGFRDPTFLLVEPALYNFRLDRILHIVLDLPGFAMQPQGRPLFCNALSERARSLALRECPQEKLDDTGLQSLKTG